MSSQIQIPNLDQHVSNVVNNYYL